MDGRSSRRALNDDGKAGIEELRQIFALCQSTSAGAHLVLDRSLARGLSYYTGPIFEIRVPDLAGSLGGGGRYDNLIGMFSGEDIPASGISLGPRAHPRRDGRAEDVSGVGRRRHPPT